MQEQVICGRPSRRSVVGCSAAMGHRRWGWCCCRELGTCHPLLPRGTFLARPSALWPASIARGPCGGVFGKGLAELGYVEGQTIIIEWRVARVGDRPNYRELVDELVRLRRRAGTAKGQVTKQLDLLRSIVPRLGEVAILVDPGSLGQIEAREESQPAAADLGIQVQLVYLRSAEEMEATFATDLLHGTRATHGGSAGVVLPVRKRFAELLLQRRLASIHSLPVFVEAGMLMLIGPKGGASTQSRLAATYVERILKGAGPADLPIQSATEFDFVINTRTAETLGLTIRPEVAAQVTKWVS